MKRFNFKSRTILVILAILFFKSPVFSAKSQPELSIITDRTQGISVSHGLTKLTDALTAKKVSFEKVLSLQEARGKSIIVAGPKCAMPR